MHWDEETSDSALYQGFFCPEGSSAPEPCEEGTYSSRPGLCEASECTLCDGGKYCTGVGKIKPSGNCEGGFYCRQQSISAVRAVGESGHLFRALIKIRCTDVFFFFYYPNTDSFWWTDWRPMSSWQFLFSRLSSPTALSFRHIQQQHWPKTCPAVYQMSCRVQHIVISFTKHDLSIVRFYLVF